MVKRRTPQASSPGSRTPSAEEIERFASGADSPATPEQPKALNENAPRDFKSIRVPFNEYEYRKLEEACRKTGRSKLNFIRYAMLNVADQDQ